MARRKPLTLHSSGRLRRRLIRALGVNERHSSMRQRMALATCSWKTRSQKPLSVAFRGRLTHRSRRTASPPLNSSVRFHGGIVRKLATVLVALCFHSGISFAATTGDEQASSFINLYSALCLKHVNNLDALREKLRPLPKLPPEKAEHFLAGRAGDVWPIPDKHGTFVLALIKGENLCAVYARRADTEAVQQHFSAIVATAPPPLVATPVANKRAQTSANGQTRTVAYEWSAPNAHRKMLFTLTTASSATAQIQAMGSAAIVSE